MAENKITPEDIAYNRRLKKALVESLFEVCETFYLHCLPHPELFLGARGLVDNEKEEGIVLVFGPYSARRLSWDEKSIDCDMHFARWEPVHIPWECVHRVFDKPGQFLLQCVTMHLPEPVLRDARKLDAEEGQDGSAPSTVTPAIPSITPSGPSTAPASLSSASGGPSDASPDEKVIEVDFTKRKKK